ncbi:MAG: PIN domain-containing protein, partial [bacterium]
GTGRNALDFHIAYYIGRLAAESPGATFLIVSKDTGFDPLIKHLKTQNITCHRLPSLSDIPGLASAQAPSSPDRIQKVADSLLNRKDSRPRKLKTLTAFIKGQLNDRATDAAVNDVVARLTQAGMSTQPDGKLTWPSA